MMFKIVKTVSLITRKKEKDLVGSRNLNPQNIFVIGIRLLYNN